MPDSSFDRLIAKPLVTTMSLKGHFKRIAILVWVGLFFLWPCAAAQTEAGDDLPWRSIETKHTIIRYQNADDLEAFDEQIDYAPGERGLVKSLFSGSDSKSLPEKLARKIDALFERVQEILDMRKKMKKVKINLYGNKRRLAAAYQRLFKKSCGVRSWYLYEFKTIYSNVSDLHAGMMAHEMGHHIIDHYLIIRPPRATAEILARYVDKNLHKKVRKY